MGRARSTLVLLAVFIALAGYVYFVELERRPASETPPNEQLFTWETDNLTALTIDFGGEETTLERVDDAAWQLTAPITTAADETQVSSITSALASLDIRRVLSEGAGDLSPFGLDEPNVEVSVVVSGAGSPQRLLIGDTTPTGGERYAKLAASDRVILIASHLDTTFSKSTFDLRHKTILGFEASNVTAFEIESAGDSLRFTKDQNEWRLAMPWDVRSDFSTVEGAVGRLSTGQIRSVISEGFDDTAVTDNDALASYGLADPSVTATVRLGSATATLLIGTEAVNGAYYAKDASRSVIFTVDSTLVTDLQRAPGEYRDKGLFDFRPFNASRLELARPDGTLVFERVKAEGDQTEDAWMRPGADAPLDRSGMDDLLAKLSNLRAESFEESRADIGLDDGNILVTVRVAYAASASEDSDAAEEQVTLWRAGDETYGIHGEEPGAARLDTRSVDDALEALVALVAEES